MESKELSRKLKNSIPLKQREKLEFITKTLMDSGEECFIVGGSVRDLIMGRVPYEFDFATSAEPKKIKSLFKKVFDTGILHGTVTVLLDKEGFEITTYRTEQGYSDGRRPDQVKFGVSLSEDLQRRDFTMNAIAFNILTGEMVDEHKGLDDIENRIIRTIGDPIKRFSEDGLRPIRGIRFASSLGFQIDIDTISGFLPTRHITKKVSVERVQVELKKILLSTNSKIGMDYLIQYQYLEMFLSSEIRQEVNSEYFELMNSFRNANYFDHENLVWYFFTLIWFNHITWDRNKNPIRELKLSTQVEKESKFFYSFTREWESILDKFNQPNSNKQNLERYLYYKHYFSVFKIFYEKNPEWEILTLHKVLRNILEFLTKINRIDISLNLLEEMYHEKGVWAIGDLAIDGNWIQEKFPNAKGKDIGRFLNSVLEEIWLEKLENDPSMIFNYGQSFFSID